MKTIYKLLTLFLICLLPINVLASVDDSIPENSTPVESVNVTVEDTSSESVMVGPDANYLQYHPSMSELKEFAANSRAQGNYSFEQELIAWDDRIPFDTYVVYLDDHVQYTITMVYNNVPTQKGYGNSQFYSDMHYVSQVSPSPMAICKPLRINALNSNWYLKTALVKDYKIVNSHYGREIVDDCEIEEPEEPGDSEDNPIEIVPEVIIDKPVPSNLTIDNDKIDADNSTVVENVSVNNTNSVNTTEIISNITGSQNNTSNVIGNNSSGNVEVNGNGNIIKNVYIIIDNIKGFIGSLNINV